MGCAKDIVACGLACLVCVLVGKSTLGCAEIIVVKVALEFHSRNRRVTELMIDAGAFRSNLELP